MPKISVIIPNYNHAKFLSQRIESILNQTYQDCEIIILDDFSTDNSCEIIKQYAAKDKRITYYFNKINSGSTFKQWNKGIKLAKGEYIWIAESDDFADIHFLEKLVPILDNNQQVGLAYCQSYTINENDEIIGSMKSMTDDINKEHWNVDYINSGIDEIKRYFVYVHRNTIPNVSACLIRKNILIYSDLINSNYRLAGDLMLYIKILEISDIAFIAESYNYYRIHKNNVRTNINSAKRLIEHLKIYSYIKKYYSKTNKIEEMVILGRNLKNILTNKFSIFTKTKIFILFVIQFHFFLLYYVFKK